MVFMNGKRISKKIDFRESDTDLEINYLLYCVRAYFRNNNDFIASSAVHTYFFVIFADQHQVRFSFSKLQNYRYSQ